MTFPTINYKFNGIEEAKSLPVVVEQKFSPLAKLITEGGRVTCQVEFEKITSHQHGRIYRVEANLSVNGTLYRAEATELSFEGAIDKVRDELDSELSRSKDKQDTVQKRAGRIFKSLLTRG